VNTRGVAIAAVLSAMVLVVLDAAIANVALPTIARSLRETPAMSVWVMTAYQTALVMALLPCAALGDSLGHRRVFTAGVAVFTVASVLCALAPSLPWLVAARFVQGLGGAAVMALGVALLRLVVPSGQLGAAIGWNALAVALSSAAGPTLGAAILSGASWPWLFAVNLPLGVAVLMATRGLPPSAGTGRRVDGWSAALNAGAFAALVMGAELLTSSPLTGSVLLVSSAIALAALVRRELPRATPLIPLDLLRNGSFRTSVIASVCLFVGQTTAMVALPFYLQRGLGQGALDTGMYLTPWPLTVAIAAPLAGRLARRIPTARLCAAGAVLLAAGLAAAALWPMSNGPQALVPITMVCGLGFGLFNVPNNRNMFLAAPEARSGAAGGMQGTARLVGQTAGAVLMTVLFTQASPELAPRIGLGIGAVFAMAAGVVSAAGNDDPTLSESSLTLARPATPAVTGLRW
jgi:DHA2 family multidrug resistance protein-like MFS transporter